MGWVVAANMARLKADALKRWPGTTIYTVGDLAHAQGTSGHNPDDMSGVRAELSDGDSLAEVRALDFMLGPKFKAADAAELARILTANAVCRTRLFYVIYNGRIAGRSSGWRWESYDGSDPHRDHVHASGWWSDDANSAAWPISTTTATSLEGSDMALDAADKTFITATINSKCWGYPFAADASMLAKMGQLFAKVDLIAGALSDDSTDREQIKAQLVQIDANVGQVDEAVLAGLTGPLVVALTASLTAALGDVDTDAIEAAVKSGVREVLGSLDES